MKITIDDLIATVRAFLEADVKVTIANANYISFKEEITEFIYFNHLESELEWNEIQNNLVWKSSQYMVRSEADTILVQLEKLKQKLLIKKYDPDSYLWSYIHPLVEEKAKSLFRSENYSEAVRAAFVEINSRVKKIYLQERGEEKDGQDLMRKAFNRDNPVLIFEGLENESGRNVQEGYMQIFAGCIQGIRNPKSHENISISKEDAIKRLILAGLLMDKIDEALAYSSL